MTKKQPVFWDGPFKHITPVVALHVDVQAHSKLLSVFPFWTKLSNNKHNVPLIEGPPTPPVHCQTEESHTFSVKFVFGSFFLSLSLLQRQSLSLSLHVHLSSLLLYLVCCLVLSYNAELLFLLAFSLLFSRRLLSVTSAILHLL